MKRGLLVVVACVAVVVASIAAIVVTNNRTEQARLKAELATRKAEKAASEAKKARMLDAAESSKAATAERNAKAAKADLEAKKIAQETALTEERTAKANAEKAKAEAETESAKAQAAADLRKAKEAELEAAQVNRRAEEAKQRAAAAELANTQLKSQVVLAEAQVLEGRRIDFETRERDLREWQQDLEQREEAIRPQKTAADLSWVPDAELNVVGETNTVKKAEKVLPENDPELSATDRELARSIRLWQEEFDNCVNVSSNAVMGTLLRLYNEAHAAGREVDEAYYYKTIKGLYPSWKKVKK